MKKIFTLLTVLAITACVYAQAPQKMSYQSVIRNSNNSLVSNTNVGIQISVLHGSASGQAVYVERHFALSNGNGLVSLEIGGGTIVSGTFALIDWANGPYFIKTETDLNGGANYTISATNQLLSVPYAFNCLNTIPAGSVIMYSGAWDFDGTGLGIGSLAGWALCNGGNGAPDLSNTFVMSTTDPTGPGQTGGANSYTLSTSQLPPHLHSFTTSSSGSHSHNITVNSGGSHYHTTYGDAWGTWHATNSDYGLDVFENSPQTRYFPANATSPGNSTTSTEGSHSHAAYSNSTGSHTHTGTTEASGSGSSIDNRPAFVKLAYIMKL